VEVKGIRARISLKDVEEARRIRREMADWDYINKQPPRIREALKYYIETGDLYVERQFAIADTCFLIDWARYRDRDLLFKIFNAVFVPESVLREIKSEATVSWVASKLAENRLALYTETEDELEEARRLIEMSRRNPRIPSIDLPEAVCLSIGRRRGYIVLTENKGAIMASELLEGYRSVTVWRALEILLAVHLAGEVEVNCNNPIKRFMEYQEDTLHIFPHRDLIEVKHRIERIRCRGE